MSDSHDVRCPGCGELVQFFIDSTLVKICPHCQSAVERGAEGESASRGKVGEILDTHSPLRAGMKGRYDGRTFVLAGRAQYRQAAGGVWDEWYLSFPRDRWGWLAEAQGRYYLTFPTKLTAGVLPTYEKLELGKKFSFPATGKLAIAEMGQATSVSARGEIPWRMTPGAVHRFADLSGGGKKMATIDYSDAEPLIFVGHEVTLADLGLAGDPQSVPRDPRLADLLERATTATEAQPSRLRCPECQTMIQLRAADRSVRVVCPSCDRLLNVREGALEAAETKPAKKVKLAIPLGAIGKFHDGEYTIIGFLRRMVKYEGIRYYWQEYLLYRPRLGFRWLVHSDNHWSFVEPVAAGEITVGVKSVSYNNRVFRLFAQGRGSVAGMSGEFYWEVAIDETVWMSDYIAPPYQLSREATNLPHNTGPNDGEVNWSLAKYLTVKEVEEAFGITELPRPSGVGSNQPFRYKSIYTAWALVAAVAVLLAIVTHWSADKKTVFSKVYALSEPSALAKPAAVATGTAAPGDPAQAGASPSPTGSSPTNPSSPAPAGIPGASDPWVAFDGPIEIAANRNIRIMADSRVSNSWVYVAGDLYNEETGLVQSFELPIEYYHGVDDGEAWSEGETNVITYVSALPAGQYTLRVEVQYPPGARPSTVSLQIGQGYPRVLHLFLFLLAISLAPGAILIWHYIFERRRWRDSDYQPYLFSSGSDHSDD